jgi:hypothetical protein
VEEALAANQLLEQRKIQSDVRKSLIERNEAGKEAIRIEERLASIRTKLGQQAFENELDNITAIAFGAENVNEAPREQIKLYLKRDEAFMKGREPANRYKEISAEITRLLKEQYDQQASYEAGTAIKIKIIEEGGSNLPLRNARKVCSSYKAWHPNRREI